MRYIFLIGALAAAGCASKLDNYEDAARRVRQVCVENGNALGTPAFNRCFETTWASSLEAESRRGPAPWPFAPVSTSPNPPSAATPPGSVRCQTFGGVMRCM